MGRADSLQREKAGAESGKTEEGQGNQEVGSSPAAQIIR